MARQDESLVAFVEPTLLAMHLPTAKYQIEAEASGGRPHYNKSYSLYSVTLVADNVLWLAEM